MTETGAIEVYHAHVYFDEGGVDSARDLCEAADGHFDITMGRVHEKPVGPHPRWSCQLAFAPSEFARVIPWLALNRGGHTVFIHPETGDALTDHTDHAMWMGEMLALNLDIFRGRK
jgi:aromatic ring-cleaving dioxygenase